MKKRVFRKRLKACCAIIMAAGMVFLHPLASVAAEETIAGTDGLVETEDKENKEETPVPEVDIPPAIEEEADSEQDTEVTREETQAEEQPELEEEEGEAGIAVMSEESESSESTEPLIGNEWQTGSFSEGEGNIEAYARPSICSSQEWQVLQLVNQERMKRGLAPLSMFSTLQSACDVRAEELVQRMEHTRPNGKTCFTVLDEKKVSYLTAGENIAAGYGTAASVVNAWMNSPGHRANILDEDFTHLGAGYTTRANAYRYYWVQLFTGWCTPTSISVQNTANKTLSMSYGASLDSLGLVVEVKCEHGTSYMPLVSGMCSGYSATKAGTEQVVTVSYGGRKTTFKVKISAGVVYRTHVQDYGWQGWVSNGKSSGTSGQAKRLEGIQIKLTGQPVSGDIEYRTHVQDYGWQGWVKNGAMSGTSGKAKRLEAIQIRLTGEMAKQYDVYYQVHAEYYGWLGWAKNGAIAGTAGYGRRLEAINIVYVKKGASAPGSTVNAYRHPLVRYRTHVQDYGWQGYALDGAMSGTSGKAKRLEAIQISLPNQDYSGNIEYKTHVQDYGWQGWVKNGALSGTSGKAKRLEAIQIRLTGEMAKKYDVYYRVHAEYYGWLGWAKNGKSAGTAGYGRRLEGIQIVLVAKGGKAPGSTNRAFVSK